MWRNKAKAKLTDKEVEILRRMLDQGVTQKEIVVIFELSKGYVSRIANYLVR
jgi:DNA-directed RNA polymerase specialized sigma subunit